MTRMAYNDEKPKKTGSRSARLAAALRVNLHRRKAQERKRGASVASETGESSQNDKNR